MAITQAEQWNNQISFLKPLLNTRNKGLQESSLKSAEEKRNKAIIENFEVISRNMILHVDHHVV